ncbi:MAG: hypothetical protein V4543_07555 [Bacteroidota bacterium]
MKKPSKKAALLPKTQPNKVPENLDARVHQMLTVLAELAYEIIKKEEMTKKQRQ